MPAHSILVVMGGAVRAVLSIGFVFIFGFRDFNYWSTRVPENYEEQTILLCLKFWFDFLCHLLCYWVVSFSQKNNPFVWNLVKYLNTYISDRFAIYKWIFFFWNEYYCNEILCEWRLNVKITFIFLPWKSRVREVVIYSK